MKLELTHTVVNHSAKNSPEESNLIASTILSTLSGLPKQRIKDAMSKGAVSLKRGKQTKRIRKNNTTVKPGDILQLHYDDSLLALRPPVIDCLEDRTSYSVWFKPAGIMSQGNQFGDHMSMLRIVQTQFNNKREVFPVHRLDRETSGLIIIAHTKKWQRPFLPYFRHNKLKKNIRRLC